MLQIKKFILQFFFLIECLEDDICSGIDLFDIIILISKFYIGIFFQIDVVEIVIREQDELILLFNFDVKEESFLRVDEVFVFSIRGSFVLFKCGGSLRMKLFYDDEFL